MTGLRGKEGKIGGVKSVEGPAVNLGFKLIVPSIFMETGKNQRYQARIGGYTPDGVRVCVFLTGFFMHLTVTLGSHIPF